MKDIPEKEKSYIAGFLEGDGCFNAHIIRREDSRLRFQIRVSIIFFQKSNCHWFLIWLKKRLVYGAIRKRPDGISEYAIVGNQMVRNVLENLQSYLQLKKEQAKLVLDIINHLSKLQNPQTFIKLCELVDKLVFLNNSKKRLITSLVVRNELKNIIYSP
jgi:hypothetical protein